MFPGDEKHRGPGATSIILIFCLLCGDGAFGGWLVLWGFSVFSAFFCGFYFGAPVFLVFSLSSSLVFREHDTLCIC